MASTAFKVEQEENFVTFSNAENWYSSNGVNYQTFLISAQEQKFLSLWQKMNACCNKCEINFLKCPSHGSAGNLIQLEVEVRIGIQKASSDTHDIEHLLWLVTEETKKTEKYFYKLTVIWYSKTMKLNYRYFHQKLNIETVWNWDDNWVIK